MRSAPFQSSDLHQATRRWRANGGTVRSIRGTGELRFDHPYFDHPLRIDGRRHCTPKKLVTRINQLQRTMLAGDSPDSVGNCDSDRGPRLVAAR